MSNILIVFAITFAGLILIKRRHFFYGLLALVAAGYIFHPSMMENLAAGWFHIAASESASEVLSFLIIAAVVLIILGPKAKRKLSSGESPS